MTSVMKSAARCVTLVSLLFAAPGCGGGHEALEKELGELRAEISRLRAAQASMSERLDTLDVSGVGAKGGSSAAKLTVGDPGRAPSQAPAAPASPRDGDRPELNVVRLAPSEGDGDVDNDPSRPVVRAVGSGDPRETLNNRTIAQRGAKKGLTTAKKTDGEARPAVKQ